MTQRDESSGRPDWCLPLEETIERLGADLEDVSSITAQSAYWWLCELQHQALDLMRRSDA
jgi:hypothetical protein